MTDHTSKPLGAMYPPPKNVANTKERLILAGIEGQQADLHTSLDKRSRKDVNVLKQSGSKTVKQGNLETSPNSRLSKMEEGASYKDEPLDNPHLEASQDSSLSTLKGHNSHELRTESQKSRNRQKENYEGQEELRSGGPYIGESNKRQNRPAYSRQFLQQNPKTQKTITLTISHPRPAANLNNIIDSFDTVRNIGQKPVANNNGETIFIEDSNCPDETDLLGFNDSLGSWGIRQNNSHVIWNQDQYELNDLNVEELNEREPDSMYSDSHQDIPLELELTNRTQRMLETPVESEQLSRLNEELQRKARELQLLKQENSCLKEKLSERQTNVQRYQELQEENKELNDIVLEYKREEFQNDVAIDGYRVQIQHLTAAITSIQGKLYEKEEVIQELVLIVREKEHQWREAVAATQELDEYIRTKDQDSQAESDRAQKEIGQLKETVRFYKDRLQEQGFTFNLDEIKHIKELFECQIDNERKITQSIEREYQQSINHLQREKDIHTKELQNLRSKKVKSKQMAERYNELHSQTAELVNQYDNELKLRDEEIIALKQHFCSSKDFYAEINLNHCQTYIKHVDILTSAVLSSSPNEHKPAELIIEFVYIVNKLGRILQVYQAKVNGLQEEIMKMGRLLREEQKLNQQEVELITWDMAQLGKEKDKITANYEDLKIKYYALAYQQRSSVIEAPQVEQARYPSLASSAILSRINNQEDSPLSSFQGNSSIDLKQESRKETVITLEQALTKQMVPEQERLCFAQGVTSFAEGLLKLAKKPMAFKPNEIAINKKDGAYHFQLSKNSLRKSKESEYSLFYAAPEVLLGFSQSEQSYVWTLGLIIDELFHGDFFYQKINLITSREENYRCRNEELRAHSLLESMLKKKQKERCSLTDCRDRLLRLVTDQQASR